MYKGERLNIGTHLLGLYLAVAGICWLGMRMWEAPSAGTAVFIGFVMYAVALLTVYLTSTLFHSARGPGKTIWATADHCAIYLLIAGTYTAMAMLCLSGLLLYGLLAVVWLSAGYGVTREILSRDGGKPSLGRYLLVGWLAVGALVPVMQSMNNTALIALLGGAAVYSAGTFFYRNARGWTHAHGVWHLFVLGGSACHFFAIMALLGADR